MTSTTRYRERFQCSKRACRARFAVKRRAKRTPKCPQCGSDKVHSIEALRQRQTAKQITCTCNGYPFPHAAGTLRFCISHPLADVEPTTEEYHDYRSCIETPRSY